MSNCRLIRTAASVLFAASLIYSAGAGAQSSQSAPQAQAPTDGNAAPSDGDQSSGRITVPGLSTMSDTLGSVMQDVKVRVVDPPVGYATKSVRAVGDGASTALSSAGKSVSIRLGSVWHDVTEVRNWPKDAIDDFIKRLNDREFANFSTLVDKSGFAISNVEVGLGIIPSVSVHFTHTRDITAQEYAALEDEIRDYSSELGAVGSYIETTILRGLLVAAQETKGARLTGVGITLFPFPSVRLNFDPFDYSDRSSSKVNMSQLEKIAGEAEQRYLKDLEELERRLEQLIKEANPSAATEGGSVKPAGQ